MRTLGRGRTEFIDVPDQPAAPTTPTGAAIARGSEVPAQTQATSDHGVARADSTSAILTTFEATSPAQTTVSFAQGSAPVLFGPVASAVTEIAGPAVMRGDLGGSNDPVGGGEIARGSEALASLSLDGPSYAEHGWFIVPSAANEYGEGYAAAGDFAFDVAAGEFSADWFWV